MKAWDYVKKAREVWPPNIKKILKFYDDAIKSDSNYYLIYKDKARLFYVLNDLEKSKENYLLWKKLGNEWNEEITKEMILREEKNFYRIHPWENHREYFEKNSKKNKNYAVLISPDTNEPDKNDETIQEIEKIKAEIKELKKNVVDLTPTKKKTEKQNGTCKGICKKFKAKRPPDGKRYESGQMRCQICEIYIDFRGAHIKNGQPATEDSVGVYCNCCNYRLRQHPRNRIYKEKLRESESIETEKRRETQTPHQNFDVDKINQLISESLEIIRKNSAGVYKKTLADKLMLSKIEFEKLLPKLLRIEDIVEEDDGFSNIFLKSIEFRDSIQQRNTDENLDIKNITYKMVQDHIHWKTNINKKLKIDCIKNYQKHKSLSKIFEIYPNYTKEKIKRHVVTDLRLPPKLKEIENEGGLHHNPVCSLVIALYATDYFQWDKTRDNEEEIIQTAQSISKYLQSDDELNRIFQGKKR